LSEKEINNITMEKVREVLSSDATQDSTYFTKEKQLYVNNIVSEEIKGLIKAKGLTEQQIDALMDMGYMLEEIAVLDATKIRDKLGNTAIPLGSNNLTRSTPPAGYNCVAQVPDNGGTNEWFHPNVNVDNIWIYVIQSKAAAQDLFNQTNTNNLRWSYYLWGEWGEDANPTWCHEGVDLQSIPNNGRNVRSLSQGIVTLRTSNTLNVYDSNLGITTNYQHLSSIPINIRVGSQISYNQEIGTQSTGDAHVHIQVCNHSNCTSIHSGRELTLTCINPYNYMCWYNNGG
ncbi:MAG: hypothetical protein WAX04_09425, partial [Oscillospiraceae bacterium]